MLWLILRSLVSAFKTRRVPALENLASRQQLVVLRRSVKRPRLSNFDRGFWVLLLRLWKDWGRTLVILKAETVVRWHRSGFGRYWTWKSRRRRPGRPTIDPQVGALIRTMSEANVRWGAPRIHGELNKLGIQVSQAVVSKYMAPHPRPPSPSWRSFLNNHLLDLVSVDFFTVPTATFRVLFAFVVLSNHRRRVVHFNVTEHPTAEWTAQQVVEAFPWNTAPRYLLRDRDDVYRAYFARRIAGLGIEQVLTASRSPWRNPFLERLIGSIRRECLDHMIVVNEQHLRRILTEYFQYCHSCRTHLSLEKDAPDSRPGEPPEMGKVIAIPEVGALHHRYTRLAA